MAILNEEAFRSHLKRGEFSRIYFLFGEDLFLKEFYCKQLTDAVCDERFAVFNMHKFTDEDSIYSILDACEALPMMSDYSCVLARDFDLSSLTASDSGDFLDAITQLPESTVLILAYFSTDISYNPKKSDRWKKYIDAVMKYGTVVNIEHRTPAKIAALLVTKAKDRGTSISRETAQYFVERAGDDLQTLLNEFNKLCAYSQGQPVTREMVDETVVKTIEASVFDIQKAIINGKPDRAYEIVDELIRKKTDIPSIVGALAMPYVDMYRCKVYKRAGKSSSDVINDFAYGNRFFAIRDAFADSSKCTLQELKCAIDLLGEADIRSKSTSVDDRLLIEELFARLIMLHSEV